VRQSPTFDKDSTQHVNFTSQVPGEATVEIINCDITDPFNPMDKSNPHQDSLFDSIEKSSPDSPQLVKSPS